MPQPPQQPGQRSWRQTLTEVVSGGTGGAAGITAAAPFMYFKMYMQQRAQNPQNPPSFQRNPFKWFVGSPAMATGMFPVAAFQFTVYDLFRKQLSNNGEKELTPLEKLACSVGTGALSTVFVGPQELIWTQQQKAQAELEKMMKNQKVPKEMMPKVSATEVAAKIWKEHGIKGFYRAGVETAGREMVSASVLTNLAAEYPLLAPVVGAALSQPLDGRKTAKQLDFNVKVSWKELFKAKAFSGLVVGRIPVYLVFMNVAPFVKEKVTKAMNKV